jgi:hypothetical protein
MKLDTEVATFKAAEKLMLCVRARLNSLRKKSARAGKQHPGAKALIRVVVCGPTKVVP